MLWPVWIKKKENSKPYHSKNVSFPENVGKRFNTIQTYQERRFRNFMWNRCYQLKCFLLHSITHIIYISIYYALRMKTSWNNIQQTLSTHSIRLMVPNKNKSEIYLNVVGTNNTYTKKFFSSQKMKIYLAYTKLALSSEKRWQL